MRKLFSIGSLFVLAALAGCAIGPDYKRPAPLPGQPLPETFSSFTTNGVTWKVAEPSAQVPRGDWWRMFGDAELNRLETLALTNNQNLAAAAAHMRQSRELLSAARSEFYPQLTAGGTPNGDITRQRTSVNQPISGSAAGAEHTYDTFTAPIYLGWELDLWGRVRRESEAAKDRYRASAADLESARLAIAAEVANDYFSVRELEAEYALITNTITTYRRSLDLTQNRRRGGIVTDLDVAQAETQLRTAEAQSPDIQLRRAQALHALAIACGESPVGFALGTNSADEVLEPEVPASLPSELLEQRPDIAAAELQMAATNAQIGVAKAAFFPTVRIDGLAGLQSISASTWFNPSSRFWSVGPSVTLPLFTGGLNRANLAAAHAAYDAAVAGYRQTVLGAFGEVEDALAAQHWLAEEWTADAAAVTAAQRALEIANNRYKAGLVTYLDVATAQTQALTVERSAVQLQAARSTAAVNLVKSLGGGWNGK
jgi:NodT family efflux transporter outer membrane factor (OMF) lipoprotein